MCGINVQTPLDNHGDLTAAYGNSCEASPILAETPGAWLTLPHRS